jgi:hypothetical protein
MECCCIRTVPRVCIQHACVELSTSKHRAIGSVAVLCLGACSFLCHFDLLKLVILLLSACTDDLCRLRAETASVQCEGCMSFTSTLSAFWRLETEPSWV